MTRPSQTDHELRVFRELAETGGLEVEDVRLGIPPLEPDIWCLLSGQPTYFELARLLDTEMQRAKNFLFKNPGKVVSLGEYDVKLPERELLKVKLEKAKRYADLPGDKALLFYYDYESPMKFEVPVVQDFAWHARHVMLPLLEAQNEVRAAWVLCRHTRTVLWKWPEMPSNTSLERAREG